MKITATHLYNFSQCAHRVYRDAYDDPSKRDKVNEFVEMLWERGLQHEKNIIGSWKYTREITDISLVSKDQRFSATMQAIEEKKPCIYQGRLEVDELVGEPDLLILGPNGVYMPVDIKSGSGIEGMPEGGEGKLKKHYALQLGVYVDALRRLGIIEHYEGRIIDKDASETVYDFTTQRGSRSKETWWDFYVRTLEDVRAVLLKNTPTAPALGSLCTLCHWYSTCKARCIASDDVSLIPELGASKKKALEDSIHSFRELAEFDREDFQELKKEKKFPGIGLKMFDRFALRADLLSRKDAQPIITHPFTLPEKPIELFFDIEADPTRDLIYLHGIVERRVATNEERFLAFTAEDVSPEAEKKAWSEFWNYIRSLTPNDFSVYYYSKYEVTQYKKLREKYPDVVTEEELENFFQKDKAIDLYYDIIKKYTEWPTYNHSIKTLAVYCGFTWRDPHPSGAASIQWFNEWVEDRDPKKLQRILDYNEDDCIATRVLKDRLVELIS